MLRTWGAPCGSGSQGEKERKLTWFLGNPGPRAVAGCHQLPGLPHVPGLAGPVVMLGSPSCLSGAAWWLNAQGFGKLWCPLGISASGVVPTPVDHPVLLQVHEPCLSLQALLTAALLSLQGQTPVAAIRDPEGAGGRSAFVGSQRWGWEVGAQHGAVFPQQCSQAGAWARPAPPG